MERKPVGKKAMTPTERVRRHRLRRMTVEAQTAKVVAAFNAVTDEARWAFIRWLRQKHFLQYGPSLSRPDHPRARLATAAPLPS